MECILCDKELPKQHPGINNAQPLATGDCCDDCNFNKVLPARHEMVIEWMRKRKSK